MSVDKNQRDKELDELLNLKIDELDKLDILSDDDGPLLDFEHHLSEIKSSTSDKGNLKDLQKQAFVVKIDKKIQEDESDNDDMPSGVAYSENITQYTVSERTEEYKLNIKDEYQSAVMQVEALYKSLVKGESVSPTKIQRIVQHFMKAFSNDANLLLNLSVLQPNYKDYLFDHALRVSLLSINIASGSGYSEKQVLDAGQAGLLADIGMMACPDSIRFKKGRLSTAEEFEIKKAPMMGLYILEKISGLKSSIAFASYQHHERINGEGYPNGRKGRIIHNYSKIVSIADVYQAMCSKRSYRDAHLPHQAILNIITMSKNNLLDAGLVKNFVQNACLFPIGSYVRLSDGSSGKIVSSNQMSIDRPIVTVIYDKKNQQLNHDDTFQCDLTKRNDLRIEQAIPKTVDSENLMKGF